LSCEAQVVGVQPHRFSTPPPPQVFGCSQLPQSSVVAQPSEMTPQSAPAASQVVGMQGVVPQRFMPPPPQVSPSGHASQTTVEPQPPGSSPHSAPSSWQVLGVQLQVLSGPQVSGAWHEPQSANSPQPLSTIPHSAPIS
jgi:hypothetical protein